MKFTKTILPNGLTVLKVPSSDAESVVVDFFVKTGSRSELPKEHGISHFLEHFLFKGTKKYPSALAISQLIDGIGGEMNANTGKEHTQYYIKAHHRHLGLIFEVLTDMLQNPLFDEAELHREKGVILEEINMYKDTPMYEIGNILESSMWPSEALGRPIAGTKATVTKFTSEMFRSYMNRYYQLPNMILGVSGKYDSKELNKLINQYWNKLPKKSFGSFKRATTKQSRPVVTLQYKDTEQAHLAFGFRGLAHTDKKNPVAQILGAILGGGMSSRLFTEVRERRGLAYYVRAGNGNYHDTGAFEISAGVKIDSAEEAVKVIIEELKKLSEGTIDSKELNKAKEYIKGRTTLALEDNQNRLEWFLDKLAFENSMLTPEEAFRKIDSIKSSQVIELARRFFQRKNLNLAIIGPYKTSSSFKKILINSFS